MKKLFHKLFGKRYYANVINVVGTDNFEICSRIFSSKEQAEEHRIRLSTTISYEWIETIHFRSRKSYED